MKVVIAGSRGITDEKLVFSALDLAPWKPDTVISGCASGVDTLGERWAKKHKIPVQRFPAKWSTQGKKAGILRNIQMAAAADALILVWDGVSPGSAHMFQECMRRRLPVFLYDTSSNTYGHFYWE